MVNIALKFEEATELENHSTETRLNPELVTGIEVHEDFEIPDVPPEVIEICEQIKDMGGQAFLVGGVVRDTVINSTSEVQIESKDFDLEIFGLSTEQLNDVLVKKFERVDEAGDKFPVFKAYIPGLAEPVDFAVARTETKSGVGHKGFTVEATPDMLLVDAARRRDLALNAMAYDPLTKVVYDPFGGVEDIKNKEIRVTDERTFREDPLRVLRVAQFAARFGYEVSEETHQLCATMVGEEMLTPATKEDFIDGEEFEGVTPERISTEFEKLLLKGKQPSRGIEFLDKIGYLDRYFIYEDENGEVHRFTELKNIEQPPERHPEGNTWIHTLQCIDAAAEIIVLEAKNTQSIEVGETVFESVPSFVTQRQLEELVTSASFAAEKKSNEFRRELVESVLLKLDPEFKVKQQAHLKKVEEEIESEFNAYLKRVKASESWKGPKVSEKAKINARAKIKKEVEADNLPDWESQLERMFDSLVAKRLITDEDIELLEGETKKRTISFMNRRIELDRINLERDMKMAVMLTTMFHDIGKISTTEFNEERGRLTAFGHAEAGIDPTKQILKFFHNTRVSGKVKNLIPELVMFHMSPWEAVDNYQKYLEVQKYKEAVVNYQKYLEVQKYKREHPGEELPPEMEDYPKSNPMSPWETTDDNQDDKKDHSDEELPEKMKNYPKSDPRRGLKKRARTLRSLGGNLMVLAMVAEADKRGRRPAEEGNHPLDRGMTSRGTVAEMYEIINFVKLAIEEEEKSQNVAVSGNQIKKTLKEVVGDISKGGAPFVGVVKKALLAAYDEGEFKNKDEGTSLILPTYERFSNYVAENSNDIASARDLWIELAKMEDPREALS